jgi:hypothetical protein
MSNTFTFIRGPFKLNGRERLTAAPGEVIVLEARNGVVSLHPSQRMTMGEVRFARGGYWRIATHSPEQVAVFDAPSSVSRSEFRIEIHYFVDVNDAIELYKSGSPEVDSLVDVQLRVRNKARALAAQTAPADHHGLQASIQSATFGLPAYLDIRCPEVLVGLSEQTRARIEAEAEMEERITQRRLQARLEAADDELVHTSRTRRERNRFDLIQMIARQYGLQDLDPLMIRALALEDHPSPQQMYAVRDRLMQERYDELSQFGNFFQALHDHEMLDDDGLAVLMDFARKSTTDRAVGRPRRPGIDGPPPAQEVGRGADGEIDGRE